MRIDDYINTFDESTRDAVESQIFKSRVIKQAMDTPQGKATLNSVIDNIRNKTMAIVGAAAENTKANQVEKIRVLAQEIHVMFHLMRDWAEILVDGEKHEEEMGKL
jgi:hypothetical protein